jgi:hypothetical protein
VFGLLLAAATAPLCAQQRPCEGGPVIVVTAVKVMDGQFENYMEYLNGTWRKSMGASKETGLVADYRVYSAQAHDADEADLYLVTTYPNMAAFDGIDAKMDPIMAKVTRMTPAGGRGIGKADGDAHHPGQPDDARAGVQVVAQIQASGAKTGRSIACAGTRRRRVRSAWRRCRLADDACSSLAWPPQAPLPVTRA